MNRVVVLVVSALLVMALVVGGAITAIVVLAGDDSSSDRADPTPTPTSTSGAPSEPTDTPSAGDDATEPPTPALAQFYDQDLGWEECEGDFECATLTVPLDYAEPAGETIEINLLRVPASGDRHGSLVVNPGGPGAPGTSYAAAADRVFGSAVTEVYDVVGFDPRGTGESSPVDCLSDEQLDEFLASDPNPDTPEEATRFLADVETLGQGCVDLSGDLAAHVTTAEAARDMDVLRAALRESELDYFGASYGTKLGATYADLFPERVGRLVLDGAVDLSIGFRELSLGQAGGFETALRAYVQNCMDSTDSCFLGDDVDEGLARIKTFLDEVDAEPLPTDQDGRELRVGNAFYGLITPLYNRDSWLVLSQALKQGFDGDGSTLMQLADLYASREPGGGYSDNSAEAIYAINCLDDPSAVTAAEVPGEITAFEEVSPTLGDVFAWGLTGCAGQVAESTEPPREVRAAGAAPIVVVGTTRDPATPYEWAVALSEQLESGVLVSRDGDGHTGYRSGNQCVDTAIEDYLIDGTVPEDGLEC